MLQTWQTGCFKLSRLETSHFQLSLLSAVASGHQLVFTFCIFSEFIWCSIRLLRSAKQWRHSSGTGGKACLCCGQPSRPGVAEFRCYFFTVVLLRNVTPSASPKLIIHFEVRGVFEKADSWNYAQRWLNIGCGKYHPKIMKFFWCF